MRLLSCAGAALAAGLFGLSAAAQSKVALAPSQSPTSRAVQAELVVVGKVAEIEKDTIDAPAYAGAPKDQKTTYKVAVVKIEDRLIGAGGLTQLRVGFPADAPAAGVPPADLPAGGRVPRLRPGRNAVALTAGFEGCFMLDPLPGADFYVLSGYGGPLDKKGEAYAKQLEAIRKLVKAINDPVAALKAKDLDDRFLAAHAILTRYQKGTGRPGGPPGVPVSEEENKLLLNLLLELPWLPKPDAVSKVEGMPPPSRSALWPLMHPHVLGFRVPKAEPGVDANKRMDDATTAFLKENRDRIKIKTYEK
ncbi:MAG: hypothetical protein J2P46_19200 [Zavarzinella sp.]|nr:hypothetical protein [Zavarzinella sp.]